MKRRSLSLILASGIISGMFSAAAGAVGYKFNTANGNLLVHEVNIMAGENVVNPASSDDIYLALSASETKTQRFVFEVAEDVLQENMVDPGNDVRAKWLGAGSIQSPNKNKEDDYNVIARLRRGNNAIAIRVIKGEHMRIAADGTVVRPIIVEFVANTVVRDTAVEGVLKIASPRKAQEIYFHGVVAKSGAIEVDVTEEQTIPSGYRYAKESINAIRSNGDNDEFIMNVLPTGTRNAEPITITVEKAKTMKAGNQVIKAEVYEDDEAETHYAYAHDIRNDVAVFDVSIISTGKVKYDIPVEVIAAELGGLEEGARVHIYVFNKEDSIADKARHIEGGVINGKIVFVEDPAQFTREDDEVFLISKYELNIEEAPEVLGAATEDA